ncbi:hypothetical protein THAOC_11877 [Thalassiosira oceanica]|uniref:MOSC domain-containing protein n=1 Tax=Thalassiosira oceanica TaxID=159749 RepID=K0SP45_THAOC|nr:hypothetical protein THAOC_11877 [Thalassiosira oceanica]|eukprot:EJK67130.1 hypothetical protein THAOC_11877 [Thalassiosira oceanica]
MPAPTALRKKRVRYLLYRPAVSKLPNFSTLPPEALFIFIAAAVLCPRTEAVGRLLTETTYLHSQLSHRIHRIAPSVKSLRAVPLSATAFDKHGLRADRRLMLVRPNARPTYGEFVDGEATHRFFTQRQCSSLATIEASEPVDIGGKVLIKLSSTLLTDEHVFVDVSPSVIESLPVRYNAGLWGDVVEVADVGDAAADFVSKVAMQTDIRLVCLLQDSTRRISDKYCPDAARGPFGDLPMAGLTDGFPILVTSQASLDELNKRLRSKGKDALPMSRFRPNIVIRNSTAFDEDNWKAIKIGTGEDSVVLHIVKGCPRCKQSCTDQLTGDRSEEPLETLSEFRALGTDIDVYFGQNAVMNGDRRLRSVIKLGDPVTVLSRGDPVWDLEQVQAE